MKNWKARVELAPSGDEHIQRGLLLADTTAKKSKGTRHRRENMPGRPYVARGFSQSARTDNDGIGNGAQQAHHHAVVLVRPADGVTIRPAGHSQGDDAVEGGYEIAEDIRPPGRGGKSERTVQR